MKIFSKILLILILTFGFYTTNAWFFADLISSSDPKVKIDCSGDACNIQTGIDIVKNQVNWIEQNKTFSQYIQDIVGYLLTFLTIIAVIYIIYAWFRILIGAWEEEVLKKQKSTILYVVIWLAVIWIAYPLTLFIFQVLNATPVANEVQVIWVW